MQTSFQLKRRRTFFDILAVSVITLILATVLVSCYHGLIYFVAFALPKVFTLFLPAITLGLGVRVISLRHPVHALLCLIVIFFNTVLLYLAAEAEFLALVFLIVYVGAIAILFLFVIRLLNVKELTAAPQRKFTAKERLFSFTLVPLAISFRNFTSSNLGKLLLENNLLQAPQETSAVVALEQYVSWRFHDIRRFSQLLYTYYSYLFRLTALLLLTARLGAIVLATSAIDENKENSKAEVLPVLRNGKNVSSSNFATRPILKSSSLRAEVVTSKLTTTNSGDTTSLT